MVKVIRYLDGDNYKYTVDDGEDFPCERDLSGTYIELSEVKAEIKLISESYEANKQGWEADIAALRERQRVLVKAAQRLVDRAKNREQEDWAGLADVLELQDALAAKGG